MWKNWLAVNRQTNNLWIKGQPLKTEIGPRCKLTEQELEKGEYLRNLKPHNHLQQTFPQESLEKDNYKYLQQMARETKSDKM